MIDQRNASGCTVHRKELMCNNAFGFRAAESLLRVYRQQCGVSVIVNIRNTSERLMFEGCLVSWPCMPICRLIANRRSETLWISLEVQHHEVMLLHSSVSLVLTRRSMLL
jgi:hypothetical protein